MMSAFQCEYCSKSFTTKFGLKTHQTRVKYCLEIQRKLNVDVVVALKPCEYCEVDYDPAHMKRHLLSCKEKNNHELKVCQEEKKFLENQLKSYCSMYEDQLKYQAERYEGDILKLKEELSFYKGKVDVMKDDHECLLKLAAQPKTTTNTITNNKVLNLGTLDLSQERLRSIIQSELTYNHGVDGQRGIAGFVNDKVLIDDDGNSTYLCTDPSRKVFKYKDEEGKECKDLEARNLTKALVDANIIETTQEVCMKWCLDKDGAPDMCKRKYMQEKTDEVRKLRHDNTVFSKELSVLKA